MSTESVMLSNHLILCCPLLFLSSLPMSQFFASGGQNTGASASASVLQWILRVPLGLTGFWSPWGPRDSQEPSPIPQFESINSLVLSLLYGPTLTSVQTTGKTIALTIWTFVGKVMSLFFNMLSRFVIVFLSMSKLLLISWLQSPSADFGAQENKFSQW